MDDREHSPRRMDVEGLQALMQCLVEDGYRVIGPTRRDGAIVCEEIQTVADLPVGWTDEQGPGHYRLVRRGDDAHFGYNVGPQSWKAFLHPARMRLFSVDRGDGDGFQVRSEPDGVRKMAFLGVRPCELKAIRIQDRIFLEGDHVDSAYAARRSDAFIVAVHCTDPGDTCFCDSMGSGPRARRGYDLALTEMIRKGKHEFLVEIGSKRGEELVARLDLPAAGAEDLEASETLTRTAAGKMGRSLDTRDVKGVLYRNPESPVWKEIGERCLSCTNCTMSCPTCFCTSVEDVTDLTGQKAERWRQWDSCFTLSFSYIHGGSVRRSGASRYRQWLTHKLAAWQDQFETSGCVGCGRCITWCPVGIDLTESVRALRSADQGEPERMEEVVHDER